MRSPTPADPSADQNTDTPRDAARQHGNPTTRNASLPLSTRALPVYFFPDTDGYISSPTAPRAMPPPTTAPEARPRADTNETLPVRPKINASDIPSRPKRDPPAAPLAPQRYITTTHDARSVSAALRSAKFIEPGRLFGEHAQFHDVLAVIFKPLKPHRPFFRDFKTYVDAAGITRRYEALQLADACSRLLVSLDPESDAAHLIEEWARRMVLAGEVEPLQSVHDRLARHVAKKHGKTAPAPGERLKRTSYQRVAAAVGAAEDKATRERRTMSMPESDEIWELVP